jgi:hypothetical protein
MHRQKIRFSSGRLAHYKLSKSVTKAANPENIKATVVSYKVSCRTAEEAHTIVNTSIKPCAGEITAFLYEHAIK